MINGYRNLFNAQGLKSLIKNPVVPPAKLAIGDADEKADIPLLIFREQGTMPTVPVTPHFSDVPYEKTALKGVNDSLSAKNFVMDDFDIGAPFEGV